MGSVQEPQEETMRVSMYRRLKAQIALVASGVYLALLGCSGFGTQDPRAGLSCLDDSSECVELRQVTLKSYLADNDRKWIKEAASPQAHASGVRLFAFRTRKKELSCEELAHGKREADSAGKVLRGPDGRGLSPAQISRATLFAAEVSKELGAEMAQRRCRA